MVVFPIPQIRRQGCRVPICFDVRIEDAVGIEGLFDPAHQMAEIRVLPVDELASKSPVAVFPGYGAAMAMDQLEKGIGDDGHLPDVFGVFEVEQRADMQKPPRNMPVDHESDVAFVEELVDAVVVGDQLLDRDHGIFDDRHSLFFACHPV